MRTHIANTDRSQKKQTPPYFKYSGLLVDVFLRRIILDMKLLELKKLLATAEKEKRYVEAFLVMSVYAESVITTLATAILARESGHDGVKLSLDETANRKGKEGKKFYKGLIRLDLEVKINTLKRLPVGFDSKTISRLQNWAGRRNDIFHNFAEKMLHNTLEKECKLQYEKLVVLSKEPWFERLETHFVAIEK